MKTKWFFGLICIVALFSFSGMVNAGLVFDYLIPDKTITVDGISDDWSGINPILTNPQGSSTGGPGTDLKAIYLAKDNNYLYWRIDTWDGTFSLSQNTFTGPSIVFYDIHKLQENGGIPIGGIEAFIYYNGPGIAARYPGQGNNDWIYQTGGSEYGAIGEVAEGKIPLTFFNNLDVNELLVLYHGPNENQTYDEATQNFSWFYDTFDGATIDQNKWKLLGRDTHGNTIPNDVLSQNGTLQVNGNQYNSKPYGHYGNLGSNAVFSGDFDIRFSWSDWSYEFGGSWEGCDSSYDQNGCGGPYFSFQINLSEYTGSPNRVGIMKFPTWFGTGCMINGVDQGGVFNQSSDTFGRFRIAREGSTVQSYYYDYANSSWILMGIFPGFSTSNIAIWLQGYTGYNTQSFHVDIDDVEIVKGTLTQGTVTGRVLDANNNPVANVTVWLVNANNQYLYSAKTDSNGNFSILAPAGSYKIQFNPSQAGQYYLQGWYNNGGFVTVTAGQTITLPDSQLQTGGAISGRVTDASGTIGLANVFVSYCNSIGDSYGGTNTDENGYYSLIVPAGSWKFQFSPPSGGVYLREWFNDRSSSTSADLVTVFAEQPLTINASLETGATISGRVTNLQGIGIANVVVQYSDPNNLSQGSTNTNANGNYSLAVPAGSYRISFNANQLGGYYLPEWYYDKRYQNAGALIPVIAGDTITSIDAILETGGAISGKVTDASSGIGLANVVVAALDVNGNWLSSSLTNGNGIYTINVAAGSYRVQFLTHHVAGSYLNEYYDDKSSFINADLVPVFNNETTTGKNAQLAIGGKITGTVTNLSGSVLPNVNVFIYNLSNVYISSARTDSQGNYSILVAPGTYKIYFNPSGVGNYVPEWYSHKPDFASANTVTVALSQTTANNNAQLANYQTLTISGYVKDSNGTGIANVVMNDLSGYPKTDANGYYSGTVKYAWSPTWSGNIIPGKTGYTFTPSLRSYSNINTDQTNQNFIIDIPTPLYYEQFSGNDLDPGNWRSWQIREIRVFSGERKLFSKTVGNGVSNTTNRLEFKNPSSINHIEADVTITEVDGNYGPNGNNTAKPSAGLGGVFYNDGNVNGSTGSYLGDVLALMRILPGPDQQHLISHWAVIKYTNSVGTSWEILGSGNLSNSLLIDQTNRLSLDWNESSKTFTFSDGSSSWGYTVQDTLNPPKINWKALGTVVDIGDATHDVSAHDVPDPTLWGKISATFDDVKVIAGGPIYDDFSSVQLDSTKWATFEQSTEVINGQMISKMRNTNTTGGVSNNLGFKNPELITEFQAKVTLQEYQNNNVSASARLGGTFFNDTGDPDSGYQRDVYAQVYLQTGTLGQAPYASWVVVRYKEPLSTGPYDLLGYGTFPLPINLGQAYNLYIKWNGQQFIFKCDEYAASYTPPVPVFPPNYPSRILSTSIGTLTPYADFNGFIKVAFDDLIVSGVAQLTPIGTNISTQPLDPTTGTTPVILTFDEITQTGMTSLTTSITDPPPPPEGFKMGEPPTYYEISTTASFSGGIDVAIHYAGVQYVDENALRLLHWEWVEKDGQWQWEWVDRTTSVDTINKIIYGTVFSLSPFIIVEIPNRPPVLAPIGDQIVNEGQPLQIVISATDPNGDALTYTASNLPTGATFDPATQTFSWTPGYNQAGSYPDVLFTVTDNGSPPLSASEPITITVNNVNRPPLLDHIGNKQINEGQTLQFAISATDPDGYGLTYSTGNLPEGASFDPITRIFSWTPTFSQAGNYTDVLFKVTDDDPDNPLTTSEPITITVNNVNRPPVLEPIGNKTVLEGQLLQFTLTATDPDGNNLTYSAHNLPPGAEFDPGTQTFTWTPTFDQAGNYPDIEFTVMDDGSPMELDTQLITITVGNVNRAPVFTPVGTQQVLENQHLQFSVSATDYDGDSISYSTGPLPSGATFNSNTKQFSWTSDNTQAGTYVVDFYATDNYIEPAIGTISVVIIVGDVPTPCEMANNLINTVIGLNLRKSVENSYMANLKKVCRFVEEGKIFQAIIQLDVFIIKVLVDIVQGDISHTDGNNLINMATNLIHLIKR